MKRSMIYIDEKQALRQWNFHPTTCTRHECNLGVERVSVCSTGSRKPVGHPPRPLRRPRPRRHRHHHRRRRDLLLLLLHSSTIRDDASKKRAPRGRCRTCRSLFSLSLSVPLALSRVASFFLSLSPQVSSVCSCPSYCFQQIAVIIPFSLFSLRFPRACPTDLLATSLFFDRFSSLPSKSFSPSGHRVDPRALFLEKRRRGGEENFFFSHSSFLLV